MKVTREPIRKISLVDQIAMQLRKEIISTKYIPGENFPCEKELTLRFAASRHTVRSALQKLAKEGLIEIEHGRSNITKDYRLTIGIDVFPDLIVASPELITSDVFSIYLQYIQWIHDQIIILATEKAQHLDKSRLMEISDLMNDKLSAEEYLQNHTRFFRELLRIGNNVLLMMHYNSYINMQKRMLELGMIKLPADPPVSKHIIIKKLIGAICSNDMDKVYDILPDMMASFNKSLQKMFPISSLEK